MASGATTSASWTSGCRPGRSERPGRTRCFGAGSVRRVAGRDGGRVGEPQRLRSLGVLALAPHLGLQDEPDVVTAVGAQHDRADEPGRRVLQYDGPAGLLPPADPGEL